MAALTTRFLVDAGTKPTFGAAAASDTAEVGNGANTFAVYKNTSGSPVTVTVVVPGSTSYGQANPDPAVTLAATTGELWIPLRQAYKDDAVAGNGRCTITTSAQTNVTVAIVQVG
ncbi:hypothetical protein [Streptomyces sp. NPDC055085]